MAITPISCVNYKNRININNPQLPENQVSFEGLEKFATNTVKTSRGKILFTILASITALTTAFKSSIENYKEKKEFDKIFKMHNAPSHFVWGKSTFTDAKFEINGNLVELKPYAKLSWVEQPYLTDGKSFKKWVFNTIKEYKASGLSIEEFAQNKRVPSHVKELLTAYETPSK